MNCTKSILLAATALALFAAPQVASAQSTGAAVVFLPAPAGAPGPGTGANAISSDGTTVLGSDDGGDYVIWINGVPAYLGRAINPVSGFINLHDPSQSRPAFSANGQVALFGDGAGPQSFTPVIWTRAGGASPFAPTVGAGESIGLDFSLNGDGTVAAFTTSLRQGGAFGTSGSATVFNAYRWTQAGGAQNLGQFSIAAAGANQYQIYGISAIATSGDGNTIAGDTTDQLYAVGGGAALRDNLGAFRWTSAGGLERLANLSASPVSGTVAAFSQVLGISRDGSTVLGLSRDAGGLDRAVYWRGTTPTSLGFLSGQTQTTADSFSTYRIASNADGSLIVGGLFSAAANSERAWRWTATSGMQDLNLIVANAGLNLNGFVLTDAIDVSDNGQFIAGNAFNAAQSQGLGYVLQLAQITQTRLIVTIRLPGVTQTSIVNQSFNTQVDGLLNGRNVFTRTTTDPITGAGGVTALADARAALQVGGGLRRVVIGAPVLLSNVTTVLSTTNNTVDVVSGTTTSTATINTFGPATVTTGDLGTCAAGVVGTTAPTGCSLSGTAVVVDPGVLNSNVYTQTNNTVTPTTTPTVNQLITAKWQVSATAGNQFGTVHALVGPAAFDRGDRLVGQLLGMGGSGQGEGANRVSRAAMTIRDSNGIGGDSSGLTMFGGYFGSWQHTDADAAVPVADVKGNTNGFVLGLQKALGSARLGVAVDHGTSDFTVRDATYPETLSFKHTQLALFAGWQGGGFSLNGAAAYGFGTARTSLTTPTTPATASRDVRSWSLGAQAGYTVPLGQSASVELVGGVRHVSANLKPFTETGGPTPLLGCHQTVTRTRAYAGIEAQAGIELGSVTLTPRLHARYAHDSGDASGTADLLFASAPNGPVMQAVGPSVGRDVAELGGSLDAQVSGNVHIWAGYDGAFRKGAAAHAAKAGVTISW